MNVGELCKIIKRVLDKQFKFLSHTLQYALQEIAEEMFARRLISQAVIDAPTYSIMIQEFTYGLKLQKNISELKKYCQLFLTCLFSQGGQVKQAANALAKEWEEEIEKELGISLNIF